MTIDPRQGAILLQTDDTIHVVDLHTGRLQMIATRVPRARALRATEDGS